MRLRQTTLLLSVFLMACPGGKDGGASESGGADSTVGADDDSGATLGMSSAPTTAESGTESVGSGSTGSDSGDSTGVMTAPTVTGDEVTGEPGKTPCEASCELGGECGLVVEVETCVVICTNDNAELPPECREATEATLACLATLTCEQLEVAQEAGPTPCQSQQFMEFEVCQEPSCDWGAGGDQAGTECMLMINCPGKPEQEMKCDMETCVCLEDGVEVGSCPADGVCLDLGNIQDKGPGCCGFPGLDP